MSFKSLVDSPRLLIEADLEPVSGTRFQPTGFPDMGAAVYETPDGTRMLIVDSAQSVANRLEKTCLNGAGVDINEKLAGIPYVAANLSGVVQERTTSLVEPHRLNSPWIIAGEKSGEEFGSILSNEMGYRKGGHLDWKKIGRVVFKYDPNSMLHGLFLANLEDGRIKLARAVTGFIEARGIREALSGGVKNSPMDPSGTIRAESLDKEGVYQNVPYQRTEYTAEQITAYFNLDVSLIRSYGLPEEAEDLLISLALYKIVSFLGDLRLRSSCDLKVRGDIRVVQPSTFKVPDRETLIRSIRAKINTCKEKGLFADPAVTELEVAAIRMGKEGMNAGDDAKGRANDEAGS